MSTLPDDFQQRLKLFRQAGLEDQYGQYSGKEEQTTALKNYVRGGGSGSSTALSSMGAQPTIDLNKLYENTINSPEIKALQGEIDTKKAALVKAQSGVNDNPFYSEATRMGKLSKLNTTAQSELANLQDQLEMKRADAETKINIATKQYDIESQQYKTNLDKLNMLIDSGALLNASGSELASIGRSTGLSTSMLQGIQKQMTQKAIKPTIITGDNQNGDKTVVIMDENTGSIISQQVFPGIGKPEKDTTTTNTNKYLTQATKYLAEADIVVTGKGTADKLLSEDEAVQAYNRILALVGNDSDLADKVFTQAMSAGGYGKYGGW